MAGKTLSASSAENIRSTIRTLAVMMAEAGDLMAQRIVDIYNQQDSIDRMPKPLRLKGLSSMPQDIIAKHRHL